MKEKKLKNKSGITLIALVITIIVMLILVAVTINMAVNGGLFGYAGNAARETEAARDEEKVLAQGIVGGKSIEEWVTGGSSLLPNTKIPKDGVYVRMSTTPKPTAYYSEVDNARKGIVEELFSSYGNPITFDEDLDYGGETPPEEIQAMDAYLYRDYAYVYNMPDPDFGLLEGWQVVMAGDKSKASYYELLNSINGEALTHMLGTFSGCTNLTTAPTIPNSVTDVAWAFTGCTKLTTAPIIPSGVTNMQGTFYNCTKLTTAPIIPSSVKNMEQTFENCTELTGTITINANPTEYYGACFQGTTKTIHLTGSSTMLNLIAELRSNITYDS